MYTHICIYICINTHIYIYTYVYVYVSPAPVPTHPSSLALNGMDPPTPSHQTLRLHAIWCYLQHLKATTSHTTVPKTCLCNAYNYITHGLPLMYTIHSVPMHTCNPIYARMQYVPTNILPKYRYPPNVSCLCVICTLLHHYLYAPYTLHLLPTHVSWCTYIRLIACPYTIIRNNILPVNSLNTLHILPINWTSTTYSCTNTYTYSPCRTVVELLGPPKATGREPSGWGVGCVWWSLLMYTYTYKHNLYTICIHTTHTHTYCIYIYIHTI